MKKFMKFSGIIGAVGLLGSVVFKMFHLMGAPELLLVGTVSTGLFIIGFIVQKVSKK